MKLTLKQIQDVTFGATKIFEENGSFFFRRFTDYQLDAWQKHGYQKGITATTGVKLDFTSNTKSFAFKTNVEVGKFEVLIDNKTVYLERHNLELNIAKIELDGKEHQITFVLPSHSEGILDYVEIDDDASLIPHKHDIKFMFFGDSLTQGWRSENDSLSFAYIVSRHFNADSRIFGLGSGRFIADVIDENYPFDPNVVFVALGTNDWGEYRSAEIFCEHVRTFAQKIRKVYPDKKIIGITPTWRKDSFTKIKSGMMFREMSKLITSIYNVNGITAIDGLTLLPQDPQFLTDSVHPNNAGFIHYANNLIPHVEELLKQ